VHTEDARVIGQDDESAFGKRAAGDDIRLGGASFEGDPRSQHEAGAAASRGPADDDLRAVQRLLQPSRRSMPTDENGKQEVELLNDE
jgi:hypothetical protein